MFSFPAVLLRSLELAAMKVAKARTWVSDHARWEQTLEDEADKRKFSYAVEQYEQYEAVHETCEMGGNLKPAAEWIASHSCGEIRRTRKRMLEQLHEADRKQRNVGGCREVVRVVYIA